MTSHLFVYGSLVTAAGHAQGARLRREALLVGTATIAGRLYRVSWYPALRPAAASTDLVHGEVYRLADAVKSLAWLDEYEGIIPGGTSAAAADEYARATRDVTLGDGNVVSAWVYLYQRAVPEDARVADGRWRG
jgi:gamma-glutamylcyclotransferase (GGCT)/AIG2-like uncharacterized protein YtfP